MDAHTQVKKRLQDAKLKVTPARLLVLKAFAKKCAPMDAGEVTAKLRGAKINEVTVYRTLAALEKAGMLARVNLKRDSVYYELVSEHHHHHLVCDKCGRTESIEGCTVSGLEKSALKKSRFASVRSHSLELFGVCASCARA